MLVVLGSAGAAAKERGIFTVKIAGGVSALGRAKVYLRIGSSYYPCPPVCRFPSSLGAQLTPYGLVAEGEGQVFDYVTIKGCKPPAPPGSTC